MFELHKYNNNTQSNNAALNEQKVFQDLDEFFEFVQSILDKGNLLQVFFLLCNEESNLNTGWLVHTVLFDCGTHALPAVCRPAIQCMAISKILFHDRDFVREGFQHRNESNVFSNVNDGFPYC